MNPRIAILLSTYNGERFLAEQLESLLNQSYRNLQIVARDDGSNDDTPDIIDSYRTKFPGLFHVIENSGRTLGACAGFSFLMDYTLQHKDELGLDKAYLMFCDQDDIWSDNKAEIQMRRMEEAENKTPNTPILLHSDLRVVSESGDLIADSFTAFQGINPKRNRFGQVLFCNTATGSTAFINEALAGRCLPVPAEAVMHDWWLALAASAFGRIVYIDQPLVDYRQHGSNTLGAVKKPGRSYRQWVHTIRHAKPDTALYGPAAQAEAFLRQFRAELTPRQIFRLRLTSVLRTRSGIAQKVFRRLGRRF